MKKTLSRLLLLLLCLASTLTLGACHRPPQAALCVRVLDVGQSDAILISQGDKHMLIDTGTAAAHDALLAHLSLYGVERLELLVLTHPHEDHVGNARKVIERYTPTALLTTAHTEGDAAYLLALQAAQNTNCPHNVLKNGDVFHLGNAEIEVLLSGVDDDDANNQSLILRLTYGEIACLFMGDAEKEQEALLLATYGPERLRADLLKVGHHGSSTGTTQALLEAVCPQYAAISCGLDNSYGFPHEETLAALQAAGATCHRTDTDGTLIYESDGSTLTHIPQKSRPTLSLDERKNRNE